MRRLVGFALLFVTACVGEVRAAERWSERLQRVDALAGREVVAGHTPGLAVGVMRDGKLVFAKGYGLANLETGTPVGADTVFRVGSVTKQFTAAAVLLLVQDGKLSLDDRLSTFFPGIQNADRIRVRQLLDHTSGLANYTAKKGRTPNDFRADLTTEGMIDEIRRLDPPTDFAPGEKWRYSNSGYFLAGAIVERVSGKPLGRFLDERIFAPQGLTATALDTAATVVPGRASGYERLEGRVGAFRNANFVSMTVPAGAGALRSTIGDLLRWQDALLGGRVLRSDLLAEMLRPVAANTADGKPSAYGLGVFVTGAPGRQHVAHGGSIDGFNAMLAAAPHERVAWVVLANSGGGARVAAEIEKVLAP